MDRRDRPATGSREVNRQEKLAFYLENFAALVFGISPVLLIKVVLEQ